MLQAGKRGARQGFVSPSRPFTVSNVIDHFSTMQNRVSFRLARRSLPAATGLQWLQRRHLASAAEALAPLPDHADSFLQGTAANYIDAMYLAWKAAPESVHVSWRTYFRNMEDGSIPASRAFQPPPTLAFQPTRLRNDSLLVSSDQSTDVIGHLKVQQLVRAYQSRGHFKAKFDPLGIRGESDQVSAENPIELELHYHGLTEADLSREFTLGPGILPRFATETKKSMTLREIVDACEKTYCGSYGVEYVHIPDRKKCDWIRNRLEAPNPIKFSVEEKRRILDRLIWSSSFEKFLAAKFPNDKRFGVEGGESMIPGVKALLDRCVDEHGVEDVVIGACHRGRLNFLSNVLRKPNESIFNEFSSIPIHEISAAESGDVKYHLGMNGERCTPSGKRVQLSLVANPSHLESEDPVAQGKTRAIQHYKNDKDRSKVMCLTTHTDAAISGQGVVYETMGLSRLPAYTTGGTVHILVNNQIGFTTDPRSARSSLYCSDIAKVIDAPIFHVNADDVEAVAFFCALAADWRAEFKTDCVVDIVCYRRHGHNEIDQPMFTQPLMYSKIAQQVPVLEKYVGELLVEDIFTIKEIEQHKQWVWDQLAASFERSKDYQPDPKGKEWVTSPWDGFKSPKELATEILPHNPTSVDRNTLSLIADKISSVPEDFSVHKNLQRILAAKKTIIDEGKNIDWPTAEALAFGTLCLEGHHVRVSGQDVERGTFSQRHAVLHDQKTDNTWTPLDNLSEGQARFTISNSSLSEFGVLGFDYGYSLASPEALVIWEAQFGDFANNSQCIIDQFISSGESKWVQRSGLVLSLPHGYDGQGPEHSSARVERFLQLCNEDPRVFPYDKLQKIHQECNMQVVHMTTPANLFHVLRRQIHRQFRKPLILFFSKALLRHPFARSSIEDFTGDSQFQYIIEDPLHDEGKLDRNDVERVILCSGQVFVALHKHREALEAQGIKTNTAITRLEQLHPFPWSQVKDNLDSYPNAKTIIWSQEESLNGGAWQHVQPRIETVLRETVHHSQRRVTYVGRGPGSSTATGLKSVHTLEEKQLLDESFSVQ